MHVTNLFIETDTQVKDKVVYFPEEAYLDEESDELLDLCEERDQDYEPEEDDNSSSDNLDLDNVVDDRSSESSEDEDDEDEDDLVNDDDDPLFEKFQKEMQDKRQAEEELEEEEQEEEQDEDKEQQETEQLLSAAQLAEQQQQSLDDYITQHRAEHGADDDDDDEAEDRHTDPLPTLHLDRSVGAIPLWTLPGSPSASSLPDSATPSLNTLIGQMWDQHKVTQDDTDAEREFGKTKRATKKCRTSCNKKIVSSESDEQSQPSSQQKEDQDLIQSKCQVCYVLVPLASPTPSGTKPTAEPMVLKDYQKDGATWLASRFRDPRYHAGFIADDAGLGKTGTLLR